MLDVIKKLLVDLFEPICSKSRKVKLKKKNDFDFKFL